MDLRKTLLLVKSLLKTENISFALIGGLALVARGAIRTTQDIDILVDEKDRDSLKKLMLKNGFLISNQTDEVIQFIGTGLVDVLFARRPLSLEMLAQAAPVKDFPINVLQPEDLIGLKIQAYKNDPSREFQDKADILNLIRENKDLNFEKIKKYADLFSEWTEIEKIRNLP